MGSVCNGGSCCTVVHDEQQAEEACASGAAPRPQGRLDSKYALGKMIAEGSFGIVYACSKIGDEDFKYAVKMVDKAEAPMVDIQREVDTLNMLKHPNIVTVHDVFYEKFFVCVVMDRYTGGDLIEGMQAHWKTSGMIDPALLVRACKQMTLAIKHLHTKHIVHRDVKGDNFLMDRPSIVDQECRVIMADFGTASVISPGQRFSRACGTRVYWSPEFYRADYGLPVDLFALGVVLYGLFIGKFPFKNERETTEKKPKLPDRIPAQCKRFTMGLLEKDEKERLDAAGAASHEWIANEVLPGGSLADETWEPSSPGDKEKQLVREIGANAATKERRRVLLDRLQWAEQRRQSKLCIDTLKASSFDVQHSPNVRTMYEWWPEEKVETDVAQTLHVANCDQDDVDARASLVDKALRERGIQVDSFGKGEAKTLAEFSAEVTRGAAVLMQDASEHNKVVRVVDIVLLRIAHKAGEKDVPKFLVHSSEVMVDGRSRSELNWLPGRMKEPHENTKRVANHLLSEYLGMADLGVALDLAGREVFEEERNSRSYPGVQTVYRKEIVSATFTVKDPAILNRVGLLGARNGFSRTDEKGVTREFEWLSQEDCVTRNISISTKRESFEVSPLVPTTVGYGIEDLRIFLRVNGVDPDNWPDSTKSLMEFSSELVVGNAMMSLQDDGKPLRIVEIVLLRLRKEGNVVLVQAEEERHGQAPVKLSRLPGTKRRPDENPFKTAHRILQSLKLDENLVDLDATSMFLEEEKKDSHKYPGVLTLYKKRIITADLTST